MNEYDYSAHLGPVLNHVAHEVRRTLDLAIGDVAGQEVTGLRSRVLGYIICCGELGGHVYQRDIEAKFHIQRSSVTTLLQGMEAAGLILREAVPEDARLKRLVATEKGIACHKRVHQVILNFEHELENGLSAAEQAELRRLLQKLLGNLHGLQSRYER